MTAAVTALATKPAFTADGRTIRTRDGLPISTVMADHLLQVYLAEVHEHLQAGRYGAAQGLVIRTDQLLAARVAATSAALGLSDQPTPPNAA